jgi:branched-chain amino acid transport system substrate-binding protein
MRWASAAILAALALVGCGSKKEDKAQLHGSVTLGVLAPAERSGPLGVRAKDLMDGATMATHEINAKGGVLGRKLQLNVLDDACQPAIAYEAAKALGEGSGVAGVIGGMCDDAAQREVDVIDASNIPFLVTTASQDGLVSDKLNSTFQMNGTLYQQALSAVYWMNYRHAQRLAIVDDPSSESQTLAKDAIHLVDQAPKVVSVQTVKAGQTDLDVVAKAALVSKPDFIYWTGGPASGGALAKALHANGYTGTFTGSAASESPDFLKAGAPEGSFVTATATALNTPTAAGWRARFEQAYHRAPGLDAVQAYDSVRTLAHAIGRARSTDAAAVTKQIGELDVNLTNFLGVIRFAHDHTLLYDNRVILEVKNGAFTWKRSLRTDSLQ